MSVRAMEASVLIVDDVKANRDLLHETLEPCGYEIILASDGESAVQLAQRVAPDLILLDIMMPGMDGFECCQRLKCIESLKHTPVLFITAKDDTQDIVKAYQVGGLDYITKPFRTEEVRARIETHLKIHSLTRELQDKNDALTQALSELRQEVERRENAEASYQAADEKLSLISEIEAKRWGIEGLVTKSPAMEKVLDSVRRLQPVSSTSVLVIGESGTGKELIARAIHFGGARVKGPFLPVNCSAIPSDLVESLFFGHVKGAFSGATTDQKGYFEMVNGGTLFLDEIGDMPPGLQAKLLRVLESGQVLPVGSTMERAVDVRVLAATNTDLQGDIAAGKFRQDLYFRLARFVVEVPPLRTRKEDIPLLAEHFLTHLASEMGMESVGLSANALERLQAYRFPGNIRELRNVMERALIESGGKMIGSEQLHFAFEAKTVRAEKASSGGSSSEDPGSEQHQPPNSPRPQSEKEPTEEDRILAYVSAHSSINNTKCRELLSVGKNRAWYLLRKLHSNGQLIQDGSKRWAEYRLP